MITHDVYNSVLNGLLNNIQFEYITTWLQSVKPGRSSGDIIPPPQVTSKRGPIMSDFKVGSCNGLKIIYGVYIIVVHH